MFFSCQVLILDRKLAHMAKMAKTGFNSSYGLGNEY